MAFDLAVVRQLLTEAFNDQEIHNLAFDLFPDMQSNFSAGMTTGQMIRMVVDRANWHGRIPNLLDYVEEKNAYQYNLYTGQLGVPQVGSIHSTLPRQPCFFGQEKELGEPNLTKQEGVPYARQAVFIFTRLRKPDALVEAQAMLTECGG